MNRMSPGGRNDGAGIRSHKSNFDTTYRMRSISEYQKFVYMYILKFNVHASSAPGQLQAMAVIVMEEKSPRRKQ